MWTPEASGKPHRPCSLWVSVYTLSRHDTFYRTAKEFFNLYLDRLLGRRDEVLLVFVPDLLYKHVGTNIVIISVIRFLPSLDPRVVTYLPDSLTPHMRVTLL